MGRCGAWGGWAVQTGPHAARHHGGCISQTYNHLQDADDYPISISPLQTRCMTQGSAGRTVGHVLDGGLVRGAVVEADAVADLLAEAAAHLLRHPLGHRHCRHAPRLRACNPSLHHQEVCSSRESTHGSGGTTCAMKSDRPLCNLEEIFGGLATLWVSHLALPGTPALQVLDELTPLEAVQLRKHLAKLTMQNIEH